jgi:hypothetical protein
MDQNNSSFGLNNTIDNVQLHYQGSWERDSNIVKIID